MKSLAEIIADAASELPDKALFVFPATRWREDDTLTYGGLATRSAAAAGVIAAAVRPEDRALLLFPTGAAFWEAFVGCLMSGVIAVPLSIPNFNRPNPLLEGVCRDCGPFVLLTDESTAASLEKCVDRHAYLQHLPILTPNHWRNEASVFRFRPAAADATAFLQYTSGSTSRPKGVQISHGNLLANLELIRIRMAISAAEDSAVTWLPHYHDMGLVGSYLGALFTRLTSWCLPPEEFVLHPERWLQLISEKRATICGGPDFGYRRCVEKIAPEQLQGVDLSSWRVAYIGAEKIRPQTLSRFVDKFSPYGFRANAFFPCYGLGESTLMVTGGPVEAAPVLRPLSTAALAEQRIARPTDDSDRTDLVGCGQTPPNASVVIVHPETTALLSEEQIGEVCLAGPSVTRGYFNRPELNDTLFLELTVEGRTGRFLRTGDLGFLSAGELFITGRLSELMIVRGKNLYPEDIEQQTCAAHPAIAAGAAIAFSADRDGQEELVIAAELERSALRSASFEPVIVAIRQEIIAFFGVNPAEILLLRPASLPRTTSGKLRRLALKDSYAAGSLECVVRE